MSVNWVGLVVDATFSVAGYVAAVALGERMLPFLFLAALPISLLFPRPNALRKRDQLLATADAPDSFDRKRAVAPDVAPGRRAGMP